LKKLKDILQSVKIRNDVSLNGAQVAGMTLDSRKVEKDFLFIAYKGVSLDGHDYIADAIQNGASYIMLENDTYMTDDSVRYISVADGRSACSRVAANYYDHPTKDISVLGVTGTNGKTTVSSLLYELFSELGHKCGLISTIDVRYAGQVQDAKLTTPDAISLQSMFRDMVDHDVTHVMMEVSSHALHQSRVADVDYDLAIFTNITHDHLDYHGTFRDYLEAKQLLFNNLRKDSAALVNIDDRNGEVMSQNSVANKYRYALKRPAKYKAKVIANEMSGLQLEIDGVEVYLQMFGNFNAYNALAVYGAATILGEDKQEVLTVLSRLRTAEGRMELVQSREVAYTSVIDYAHTPDALEKVLTTIGDVKKSNAKIITVVGAGGNRDKTKRPEMAKIARANSDVLILTSDNPRDEDPDMIIDDMIAGLEEEEKKKVIRITDRKEAIKMASIMANDNDIILIAGKGHEKYQEIKGQKYPFDDKKIISALMH